MNGINGAKMTTISLLIALILGKSLTRALPLKLNQMIPIHIHISKNYELSVIGTRSQLVKMVRVHNDVEVHNVDGRGVRV